MTKFGVLVNLTGGTTSQKINVANSLNVIYYRTVINIGNWPYAPTAYNQFVAAGFIPVCNFNWLPSSGIPVPFRTASQLADFASRITDIFATISLPEIIVICNEEINPNFNSGPLSDYVAMYQTAAPIAHANGVLITNGGIYGVGLDILTWRYFDGIGDTVKRDQTAVAMTTGQISAAASPGSNPTLEAKVADVQTVLSGAAGYLDYINIHPYEVLDASVVDPAPVTAITPHIIANYQEFILAETGLPTITNETGQRSNVQPDLVTNMLQEYQDLNFDYCLWFDGQSADGADARPLNDQTSPFALQPNGEAFRDFMNPAADGPTVDIITDDTTIYLPDNSIDVTATVTPGYLHSIVSILWTKQDGPSTYTISSPTTANTTFSNLVIGSYVFRLTAEQDDAQSAFQEIQLDVVPTQEGVRYIIRFKNRQTIAGRPGGDIYRVELLPKNYSGIDKYIEGSDKPFSLKYQSGDGDIYSPIRASEAVVQIWTEGNISLPDFYNDDDTFWKVLFYGEQINGQDPTNTLLWCGYLQIDNSGEELQDRPHIIALNANDNLGLLKNIALPTPTATQIYEGILLTDLFASILKQTNISNAALVPYEVNAYLNIFENSTDDRTILDTNDFLQQTIVYTNNLQNADGSYKDCYTILNDLLNTFRAQLYQSLGAWTITRQGEFRLFTDAAVPGTNYDADFNVQDAITLDPEITIGRNLDILPINENQVKRVLRPFQFVKKTFEYSQPKLLIIQSDLSLPTGAVPFSTHTSAPLKYDDYSLTTYFPKWRRMPGDTSYLEVVTNIDTGNEIDRYIVTPGSTGIYGAMTFNNIPVSLNDSFNFSLQFKTFSNTHDPVRFYCSFVLYDTNGEFWYISGVNFDQDSSRDIHWTGPVSSLPVPLTAIETSIPDTIDNSQWAQWSLSDLATNTGNALLIPADGVLLVQALASNGPDDNTHPDLLWNNINITFRNAVNAQTNIIAQVHTQTQPTATKNNSDSDLNFDDSPLNTISGTLFRTPLVTFGSPVNNLYFYRTNRWHRANFIESLRLNEIQTFDQLFIQRKIRTIVEGDFHGLRYLSGAEWKYLSMQNIIKINFIEGLNFIFGIMAFDYMNAQFTATLYECFDDDEIDGDLDNTYEFKYLYKTQ